MKTGRDDFGLDWDLVGFGWGRLYLSRLCRLRTIRCHLGGCQVTDLLSWAHTGEWGLERLVILLSWVPAPSGPTEGGFWVLGGLSTAGQGLRIPVWTGTRFTWQEGNELVPCVHWCGRSVCLGVPSWATLVRESPCKRYGMTRSWHHSKNWKLKRGKMDMCCSTLLNGRTGCWH
jgi:hypothetical protein